MLSKWSIYLSQRTTCDFRYCMKPNCNILKFAGAQGSWIMQRIVVIVVINAQETYRNIWLGFGKNALSDVQINIYILYLPCWMNELLDGISVHATLRIHYMVSNWTQICTHHTTNNSLHSAETIITKTATLKVANTHTHAHEASYPTPLEGVQGSERIFGLIFS